MAERIFLYDTTLRDGAQTQGVDFSVGDKRTIALHLDAFGVDHVEAGWPGANPTDDALFADPPRLERAVLTAFGMTRRTGRSAANDPGLTMVLASGASAACLVGKTWDYHVTAALGVERDENLAMIRDSIGHAASKLREVLFDAEHFFDGYKSDPGYAMACLEAAAPCPTRSRTSSAASRARFPATGSASTATTTPATRSPTAWRRCAPGRARSKARSTAWANAAATPTW